MQLSTHFFHMELLSGEILSSVYYAIIYPFLPYGINIWGNPLQCLLCNYLPISSIWNYYLGKSSLVFIMQLSTHFFHMELLSGEILSSVYYAIIYPFLPYGITIWGNPLQCLLCNYLPISSIWNYYLGKSSLVFIMQLSTHFFHMELLSGEILSSVYYAIIYPFLPYGITIWGNPLQCLLCNYLPISSIWNYYLGKSSLVFIMQLSTHFFHMELLSGEILSSVYYAIIYPFLPYGITIWGNPLQCLLCNYLPISSIWNYYLGKSSLVFIMQLSTHFFHMELLSGEILSSVYYAIIYPFLPYGITIWGNPLQCLLCNYLPISSIYGITIWGNPLQCLLCNYLRISSIWNYYLGKSSLVFIMQLSTHFFHMELLSGEILSSVYYAIIYPFLPYGITIWGNPLQCLLCNYLPISSIWNYYLGKSSLVFIMQLSTHFFHMELLSGEILSSVYYVIVYPFLPYGITIWGNPLQCLLCNYLPISSIWNYYLGKSSLVFIMQLSTHFFHMELLSGEILSSVYYAIIYPFLPYGITIWGNPLQCLLCNYLPISSIWNYYLGKSSLVFIMQLSTHFFHMELLSGEILSSVYYAIIYPFLPYGITIRGNPLQCLLCNYLPISSIWNYYLGKSSLVFIMQLSTHFFHMELLSGEILSSVYYAIIYPFLPYGITIWGNPLQCLLCNYLPISPIWNYYLGKSSLVFIMQLSTHFFHMELLSGEILSSVYYAIIYPFLPYGITIWGNPLQCLLCNCLPISSIWNYYLGKSSLVFIM